MNNSFSSQQISKTSNLDSNLLIRQYKSNSRAKFMHIKIEVPKMKQSEKADELGYSSSTLQRYKNDINMLSPYRIHSNNTNKRSKKASNTNFYSDSHRAPNVKRLQMTSIDLK